MTPKLLRLKKFDDLVQLSRIFRLFDPIILGMIFVRPADEVWSNGLRHTAARAASRLNVEILGGQFRLTVFAHFGYAANNQSDLNIESSNALIGKVPVSASRDGTLFIVAILPDAFCFADNSVSFSSLPSSREWCTEATRPEKFQRIANATNGVRRSTR